MEYVGYGYNDSVPKSGMWVEKYSPQTLDDMNSLKSIAVFIGTWIMNFKDNKKKKCDAKGTKKSKKTKQKSIVSVPDDDFLCDGSDDIEEECDIEEEKVNKNVGKSINDYSNVLIIGNHGIGKTAMINIVAKMTKSTRQTINFSKIRKGTDVKELMNHVMHGKNILSMINERVEQNLLVIDDIETITMNSAKASAFSILKINSDEWMCPTIFVSDGQHSKLLTELKKMSYVITLDDPTSVDMMKLLTRISKDEKIEMCSKVKAGVIEHTQRDYRRLILTMQDLKYSYDSQSITMDMFDEYKETSKKKDEDLNLFKMTDILMQKYDNIEDCMRYYTTDKVVLPLMIHQNYLTAIKAKMNNQTKKDRLNKACEIAKVMSRGDIVENYIYGEQNWDICYIHGFYSCVTPSYMLSSMGDEVYLYLVYSSDLNKSSISKINRKNILNANRVFENKNINDYLYLSQILTKMKDEGDIEGMTRMLECDARGMSGGNSNISIGNVESLFKIDKIKKNKTSLTSKNKKEIMSRLNSNIVS